MSELAFLCIGFLVGFGLATALWFTLLWAGMRE